LLGDQHENDVSQCTTPFHVYPQESAKAIRERLGEMVNECEADDKVLHVFVRLFVAPRRARGAELECYDLPHQLAARFPCELQHLKNAQHLTQFIDRHVLFNVEEDEIDRRKSNENTMKNETNPPPPQVVFTLEHFELFLKGMYETV
jgi:hypothetical protein